MRKNIWIINIVAVTLHQKKQTKYIIIMTTNNNNQNNNQNNNNNVLNKKPLANVRKKANEFLGGFRAACMAVLEVANTGDRDAKRLCAYLGISAESLKGKNVGDTRKYILDRLPLYYIIDGSESRFPARLQKVSAEMRAAGISAGYIAVKDNYLSALLNLGEILSKGNEYEQHQVELTMTTAGTGEDVDAENTTCIVYDKDGTGAVDETQGFVRYKNAKRFANGKARMAGTAAFAEALR